MPEMADHLVLFIHISSDHVYDVTVDISYVYIRLLYIRLLPWVNFLGEI